MKKSFSGSETLKFENTNPSFSVNTTFYKGKKALASKKYWRGVCIYMHI